MYQDFPGHWEYRDEYNVILGDTDIDRCLDEYVEGNEGVEGRKV